MEFCALKLDVSIEWIIYHEFKKSNENFIIILLLLCNMLHREQRHTDALLDIYLLYYFCDIAYICTLYKTMK